MPHFNDKNGDPIDARENYIARCYRKQKVMILFDNGGFSGDCSVGIGALRDIVFPKKSSEVGSTVLCWMEPESGKPVVVSVLGTESDIIDTTEFKKKISSLTQTGAANVSVEGSRGEVFIDANSSENDGGNIYVTVSNKSKTGKLSIKVIGTAEIYTDSDCTITSGGKITAISKDVKGKINTSQVIDSTGKITNKVENLATNTTLSQTISGFKIEKAGKGLKDTLKNILNELIAFKTVSPGGEGLTDPATIIKLQSYLAELDLYLE